MKPTKYTKAFLEPIIASAFSYAEVFRLVGVKASGGMHRLLKQYVNMYHLDTSHFTGQQWNKGKTARTSPLVANNGKKLRVPDDLVFCENSSYRGRHLTKRLLEKGWEYKCKCCGINEWQKKPLTLHLDHINGIHNDNRLENLRFLCPNCHQQTGTWGAKNKDAKKKNDAKKAKKGSVLKAPVMP